MPATKDEELAEKATPEDVKEEGGAEGDAVAGKEEGKEL